jgi:hypothetical protein
MMHTRLLAVLGSSCVLVALAVPGAAGVVPKYAALFTVDAPRTADDPLVTRFAGSHILNQTSARLDELTLPSGPAVGPSYSDSKRWAKTAAAEGRMTRTVYVVPQGVASLEVFRSLQAGLTAKGFKTAFQCSEAKCGESFARLKYHWSDKSTLVEGPGMEVDRTRFVQAVFESPKAIRYALMQRGTGPSAAYAGLYVALNEGGTNGDMSDTLTGHVTALVEVVEPLTS